MLDLVCMCVFTQRCDRYVRARRVSVCGMCIGRVISADECESCGENDTRHSVQNEWVQGSDFGFLKIDRQTEQEISL